MKTIYFWNGNKSAIRQQYEQVILEMALQVTEKSYKPSTVLSDNTDYPKAEDEGNIFNKGADILVTVAGNQKFTNTDFIPIYQPIAKGLLGYRVLITRKEINIPHANDQYFTEHPISQLSAGIPETWVDADLLRHNRFKVFEKGNFDEIFHSLDHGDCDYVALGANEVESVYNAISQEHTNLVIDKNVLLYYPLFLVFYVHPDKPQLAKRIGDGLLQLSVTGQLDSSFNRYFGECIRSLNLIDREIILLSNPILPEALRGETEPNLLNELRDKVIQL